MRPKEYIPSSNSIMDFRISLASLVDFESCPLSSSEPRIALCRSRLRDFFIGGLLSSSSSDDLTALYSLGLDDFLVGCGEDLVEGGLEEKREGGPEGAAELDFVSSSSSSVTTAAVGFLFVPRYKILHDLIKYYT